MASVVGTLSKSQKKREKKKKADARKKAEEEAAAAAAGAEATPAAPAAAVEPQATAPKSPASAEAPVANPVAAAPAETPPNWFESEVTSGDAAGPLVSGTIRSRAPAEAPVATPDSVPAAPPAEAPVATPEAVAAPAEAPVATPDAVAAPAEAPVATPEAVAAPAEAPVATPEAMAAPAEEPVATPDSAADDEPQWDATMGVWVGNKAAGTAEIPDPLWIFGYGSLCWKSEFPFERKVDCSLQGWTRLFWQKSMDHRGTPSNPGRVVTVIPDSELAALGFGAELTGSVTCGVAYLVAADKAEEVLANLDFREKGGYTRAVVEVLAADGTALRALLYTGNSSNPNLDPAQSIGSTAGIAALIAKAKGPSGPNADYLRKLAAYLRSVGSKDAHVFGLERQVEELLRAAPAARKPAGTTCGGCQRWFDAQRARAMGGCSKPKN
jgi:cation transport regulator ChaC